MRSDDEREQNNKDLLGVEHDIARRILFQDVLFLQSPSWYMRRSLIGWFVDHFSSFAFLLRNTEHSRCAAGLSADEIVAAMADSLLAHSKSTTQSYMITTESVDAVCKKGVAVCIADRDAWQRALPGWCRTRGRTVTLVAIPTIAVAVCGSKIDRFSRAVYGSSSRWCESWLILLTRIRSGTVDRTAWSIICKR